MDEAAVTRDALDAAAGDHGALTRFVGATQGEVHRLCAYLVHADDAADLVQETYLRAIRALPGYRQDAPARLWLLSIARRACADHLRTRYRRRGIEERIPARPDTVEAADPSLWALLDQLDADQRTAFVLTQVLGLSYAEAATASDCPVGTIRSRVARARATLVQLLADAEAEGPEGPTAPGPPTGGSGPAEATGDVTCDRVGNRPPAGDDWNGDADTPDPGRRGRRAGPGGLW